jgi:hypothetical protein
MVAEAFYENNPMAGKDEDTPYDYDHILPKAHWGDWTGVTGDDRLPLFAEEPRKLWIEGNGIGNIQVLAASHNRAWSDSPPITKLNLAPVSDNNEVETEISLDQAVLLENSAIPSDGIDDWRVASGTVDEYRSWNEKRVAAFQRAVENRAFFLYQCYFDGLGFSEWYM